MRGLALALAAGLAGPTPPAAAQSDPAGFATVINIPADQPSISGSIGSDTQLNLSDGGSIDSDFQAGSVFTSNIEVNVTGGSVGNRFDASNGSTVNITGGSVGSRFRAFPGSTVNVAGGSVGSFFEAVSTVNVTGGSVGSRFTAFSGSTVNVAGGSVGNGFDAIIFSTVNITGGSVGSGFDAFTGSTVNVAGGRVGNLFEAEFGSTVTFSGGEFRLNGAAINDLAGGFGAGFPNTGLFTGVLADGTVFIFAAEALDIFFAGSTTLQTGAVAPSANPGLLSAGTFTRGVRDGETLTVSGSGTLGENFAVVGGTLNLDGGSAGDGLEVAFGEVNVAGGSVGDRFNAFDGSTVNVTGGSVGDNFGAGEGSTVNVSGGNVGNAFNARAGSTINVTGGSVGIFFEANSGSTVNVAGGSVGEGFNANSGSTVNLFGSSFTLEGVLLTSLVMGEAFTITDRDVTLSGRLADGSAFAFELNGDRVADEGFIDPNATLTVTLIPEPGSLVLLGLGVLLTTRRRRPERRLCTRSVFTSTGRRRGG
ncbi:MAG: PEP-CTERM sorting domain-containing protein [Planctomycetota bacterium]